MVEPEQKGRSARLTLAVLFYNQEGFVEAALQGALGQTYSPLEIVISDDASSDESFLVAERVVAEYVGPHRVILNRNEKNLGVAGNINRVMELATGEIIMMNGGDDVSMRNRASRTAAALAGSPDCLSISFGTVKFVGPDMPPESGFQSVSSCTRYTKRDYLATPFFNLNGASRAWRRRVFEVFGPISPDCPTEDSVILLRCILLGDVLATPEPQLYYRMHEGGLSQFDNRFRFDRAEIHRQYLRDIAVAVDNGLLTDDERGQLTATLELRLRQLKFQQDLHYARNQLEVFRLILRSNAYRGTRKVRLFVSALRPWKRY